MFVLTEFEYNNAIENNTLEALVDDKLQQIKYTVKALLKIENLESW